MMQVSKLGNDPPIPHQAYVIFRYIPGDPIGCLKISGVYADMATAAMNAELLLQKNKDDPTPCDIAPVGQYFSLKYSEDEIEVVTTTHNGFSHCDATVQKAFQSQQELQRRERQALLERERLFREETQQRLQMEQKGESTDTTETLDDYCQLRHKRSELRATIWRMQNQLQSLIQKERDASERVSTMDAKYPLYVEQALDQIYNAKKDVGIEVDREQLRAFLDGPDLNDPNAMVTPWTANTI